MGTNDALDEVGTSLQQAGHATVDAVGRGVQGALHGIGSGLDAAGLDSAGKAVTQAGDSVADHMGVQVAESSLDDTDDPTRLVHGDMAAIQETVAHLRTFARAFGTTSSGLRATDTEHWHGKAAEAFRAKFHPHPTQWAEAQDACETAARTWENYAHAIQWAQQQAREAIDLYAKGKHAAQQAQAQQQDPAQQASAQQAAADLAPAPGLADPGLADPGLADQQHARALLERARSQRDSAAREAASTIANATAYAPPKPSFAQNLADKIVDSSVANQVEGSHFVGGVLKGSGEIVKFARGLNPTDDYNVTHPAEYVGGVSSTAAGLVHSAAHPAELVHGLVGTGWSTDPAEAFGKLVPNIALTAATDGGGAAASTAERGAVGTAERAAEKGAAGAGERAIPHDWGDLAQPTPRVSEPAIHADSVPPDMAKQYLDHHYPWMHDINASRFHQHVPGYTQNCSNTVVTVDRRLDGAEVSTAPLHNPHWPDPRALGNPNAVWHHTGGYDDVIRDLHARGHGARGLVYISRSDGTAHVFNAVHDANGAVFLDGQSGRLAQLEHHLKDIKYMPYR